MSFDAEYQDSVTKKLVLIVREFEKTQNKSKNFNTLQGKRRDEIYEAVHLDLLFRCD